jgi:uncharacterized protein YjbJ (UPF0337 family)
VPTGRPKWKSRVKGQVKQAVGALVDDQPLKDEGMTDETVGKAEEAVGTAQRKVGEVLTHLADVVNKK